MIKLIVKLFIVASALIYTSCLFAGQSLTALADPQAAPNFTLQDMDGVKHCYSYFPILIDKDKYGKTRDEVYEELKKHNIFGRRYFYPLISQFPTYRGLESAQPGKMPVAETITEEVLCLPIFPDLDKRSTNSPTTQL